jgi:hypothetical protein
MLAMLWCGVKFFRRQKVCFWSRGIIIQTNEQKTIQIFNQSTIRVFRIHIFFFYLWVWDHKIDFWSRFRLHNCSSCSLLLFRNFIFRKFELIPHRNQASEKWRRIFVYFPRRKCLLSARTIGFDSIFKSSIHTQDLWTRQSEMNFLEATKNPRAKRGWMWNELPTAFQASRTDELEIAADEHKFSSRSSVYFCYLIPCIALESLCEFYVRNFYWWLRVSSSIIFCSRRNYLWRFSWAQEDKDFIVVSKIKQVTRSETFPENFFLEEKGHKFSPFADIGTDWNVSSCYQ